MIRTAAPHALRWPTSFLVAFAAVAFAFAAPRAMAQAAGEPAVPTPESHFGFAIGADRQLADWDQLTSYYEELARTSPRVLLDTLGTSTLERPFVMMTITSPANHARLEEFREIQAKLADPRRIAGAEERERLIREGRTVVLITHAIHSTEVGSAQVAARLAHRLAASQSERVREILDNVIVLHIPSLNPDGTQLVADWYRRWVGTPFEAAPLPWLYHHYTGHDNNRDWYAFTQQETQLAIRHAHNRWRPHIVHDIHQMGPNGARYFVPPYIDPIDPNVDPRIIAAVNQLGTYIAAEMTAGGKTGVLVQGIFDAYTPARAYQHYHGGVRILSETASARMATPTTVEPAQLSGGRGYDAGSRSWNFPAPWPGGEWRLADIVDYMDAGAMALLTNAARNRSFWLENFARIHEDAVAGRPDRPAAWVIPAGQAEPGLSAVLRILRIGDVEVHTAVDGFTAAGRRFEAGSFVVPMRQPYASFAQTLLEFQEYPDLRVYPDGPPQRPYDATAWSLPLLMGVEAVPLADAPQVELSAPIAEPTVAYRAPDHLRGRRAPRLGVYRSYHAPMTEGWTRWVLDQHDVRYESLHDADIRAGNLRRRFDVVLLQDQPARQITAGWSAETMPDEFAGGLGDEGVAALRDFVRDGGRLVAVERATDFVIDALGLDVASTVHGLEAEDFYIPGSILRLRLEPGQRIGRSVGSEGVAWFWGPSRAFDVRDDAVRVVARFADEADLLLSGWVLGGEHIAGKPAILEARVGRGSVVLFGFQPNYRGHSIATWPLLFDALATDRIAVGGDPVKPVHSLGNAVAERSLSRKQPNLATFSLPMCHAPARRGDERRGVGMNKRCAPAYNTDNPE